MSKREGREPMQTTPKGAERTKLGLPRKKTKGGLEIPVPTKGDVMGALAKAARKPSKGSSTP